MRGNFHIVRAHSTRSQVWPRFSGDLDMTPQNNLSISKIEIRIYSGKLRATSTCFSFKETFGLFFSVRRVLYGSNQGVVHAHLFSVVSQSDSSLLMVKVLDIPEKGFTFNDHLRMNLSQAQVDKEAKMTMRLGFVANGNVS